MLHAKVNASIYKLQGGKLNTAKFRQLEITKSYFFPKSNLQSKKYSSRKCTSIVLVQLYRTGLQPSTINTNSITVEHLVKKENMTVQEE